MLILALKKGQSVTIGNVKLKVSDIRGECVRLAFQAPPEVKILRDELLPKRPPVLHKLKEGE